MAKDLETPPVDNDKVERDWDEKDDEIFVVLVLGQFVEKLLATVSNCSRTV